MYPRSFFEQSRIAREPGTCFVLMPFAESLKPVYDSLKDTIENQLSMQCERADEIYGAGYIIEDILKSIGTAEIVIADMTGKNPNVFYELGIAHMARDIDSVIVLAQTMDDVPFDLRHFRCIIYNASPDGLTKLRDMLMKTIRDGAGQIMRFTIKAPLAVPYRFPNRLMSTGVDRAMYNFEISELWPDVTGVKVFVRQFRHVLGREPEKALEDGYGLIVGEAVPLLAEPWKLVLERHTTTDATFRVQTV